MTAPSVTGVGARPRASAPASVQSDAEGPVSPFAVLRRNNRPEAVRLLRLVRLTGRILNGSLGLSDFLELKGQRGHDGIKVFTPAKARCFRRNDLLERFRGLVQQLPPGTDIRLSFGPGAFTGNLITHFGQSQL